MSKTMKRVPLDFSWPIRETWKGYINPYQADTCSECEGSGWNEATRKLELTWYGFDDPNSKGWQHQLERDEVDALLEADRLPEFTRVPRTPEQIEIIKKQVAAGGDTWLPEPNGYIPSVDEVNEWSRHGIGHDNFNSYICIEVRAKRLGVHGLCEKCAGHGRIWKDEDTRVKDEAFKLTDPPTGDGFQLWNDESPLGPVFNSLQDLANWCETNATTFGNRRAPAAEWAKMLEEDNVHHVSGNIIFR